MIRRRELLALLLSSTAVRSEIIKVSPCTADNSITPCTGSGGGGPSPTVTSLTPNNGAGGTSVAIVGTNFTGATAVTFGSTPATSFVVNSATSITAVAPAGTGVINVIVTVAGHSSAPGAGNQYTYPAAPPTVTSLTPDSGPSGTSVAVVGTGFTGATAVAFGGTAATSFTVNSATSITAVAPAGSGTVNVTVTTPAGTSATGMVNQYIYIALPVVTSLTPNNGPAGTSVAVAGTGFTGALLVAFGGTSASFIENSDTSITATAPAGSGTVNVTVQTPGGTSATGAGNQYTYSAGAAVTFDPAAKGASITLSNGNLTASITAGSWTSTRATASHTTGKYYAEFTMDPGFLDYIAIGVANSSFITADGNYLSIDSNSGGYRNDGYVFGFTGSGPSWTGGDVVQFAVDTGARLVWIRVNGGNWNVSGTANPATGTGGIDVSTISGALYPAFSLDQGGGVVRFTANFGATAYAYTPPAGFGNW